jgi:hypothetical protein
MRVVLALDGSAASIVARDLVVGLPWPAGDVRPVDRCADQRLGKPPGSGLALLSVQAKRGLRLRVGLMLTQPP